ncbi:hypothetical protein PHISCL_06117 [Aspergillus sclerotialis]|uniref:C6 transcription factor n=1 Tax=Aspergillus sclerotialis TaxID=2070753 RepID=A0A3A2ZU79_9EURO|nr:hypothetical protein PHISCL_06117 [Aspergillus sclerotialis]
MSLKDITTEYTQDSFIRALVYLSKTMTRSADEIYGQRHQSLLHMWKVAVSIVEDLRNQESRIQQTLGLKLDASIQPGSLGVCQTMFTTMYYHTLLLTFRPFLIFRGHWQRERKLTHRPSTDIGSSNSRPTEAPSWLNEACNYTLTAAQKTLQHLSKASAVNDLVKQLRYHGYFVGSASFTLIYDIIHNENAAVLHLPSVYAALQTLSTMRVGDPIASTITSIQTVLRKINPSYEWSPPFNPSSSMPSTGPSLMQNSPVYEQAHHHDRNHQPPVPTNHTPQSLGTTIPNFHMSLPTMEMPMASGEDLFDFTQADMGWDFDFSTMDLETFLSVD